MEQNNYKHKCTVDDMDFYFFHISPRPLRRIFLDIAGKIVKSLNVGEIDFNDIDKDLQINKIFNMEYISNNIESILDEDELEKIEEVLFSQCLCDFPNDKGQIKRLDVNKYYDEIFKDNFMGSFFLLKEAFKAYYSNFFEKAGSVINSNTLKSMSVK